MSSLAAGMTATEKITDTILEFLEAAVHVILYIRDVYPAQLFEQRTKYGIAIQMSRHPELNTYVSGVLSSLRQYILEGTVNQISVVIQDENLSPQERFNFDIVMMGGATQGMANDRMVRDELRGLLQKLSVADTLLSLPPKDSTFIILAYCKGFPEAMQQKWAQQEPPVSQDGACTRVIPLRSADLGCVAIQLLVVQASAAPRA
eukprot:m.191851 g.191851  ORF g.191851 m.191851 type:complete len:204 (+) comp18602_c0_seq2:145-756(+)